MHHTHILHAHFGTPACMEALVRLDERMEKVVMWGDTVKKTRNQLSLCICRLMRGQCEMPWGLLGPALRRTREQARSGVRWAQEAWTGIADAHAVLAKCASAEKERKRKGKGKEKGGGGREEREEHEGKEEDEEKKRKMTEVGEE